MKNLENSGGMMPPLMADKPDSQISNYVFGPVRHALDECSSGPGSVAGNKRRVLSAAVAMFYNASAVQRLAWRRKIAEAEESGDWSAVFPEDLSQDKPKRERAAKAAEEPHTKSGPMKFNPDRGKT